jgi:hypothetical protein
MQGEHMSNLVTTRTRYLLLVIPILICILLLVNPDPAASQVYVVNCDVTILPKVGAIRIRSAKTVDDNSWAMVISLNTDGTMAVTTAKTFDENIWPEGTVVSSITATQVSTDSAGNRWLKVTLVDNKGNQYKLPAYIVYKSPTITYVKVDCQTAAPPTQTIAAAASASPAASTTLAATTVLPTVQIVSLATVTPLIIQASGSPVAVAPVPTDQPVMNTPIAPTAVSVAPTVSPTQIYYVSCLRNGIGPDIDTRPFYVTQPGATRTFPIAVGTYVLRIVDETGALLPPDTNGRVLIRWGDSQWLIAQQAIKRPAPDGSTDCDGRITPAPTLTPYLSPTPTATLSPSQTVLVGGTSTDFGDPDFGTLSYPIGAIFGAYRPAVTSGAGDFPDGTVNILPDPIATCVVNASQADIIAGKCDSAAPDRLLVTSPVAGCLYHAEGTSMLIIVVSRTGVGCKDAVVYPRLEIVLVHLDPISLQNVKSFNISVKPGDVVGLLCQPSITAKNPSVCGSSLSYLTLQFRVNSSPTTARAAGQLQMLKLLPTLRQ